MQMENVIFMPILGKLQSELKIPVKDRGNTRLFYGYSLEAWSALTSTNKKNAKSNWVTKKAQLRGKKNVDHPRIALAGRIWKTAAFVIAVLGAALLAYGLIHGHLNHTGFSAAVKGLLADPKNIIILCLAGGALGGLFYARLAQRDINDMVKYRLPEKRITVPEIDITPTHLVGGDGDDF